MKYTRFYNNIKNPLEDEQVIDKLIECYSETNDFYGSLTRINSKDKKRLYSPAKCDELHAFLFNTWKKELLSITKEQYENAIKKGLYDRSIYKLLAFLKTLPDVTTKKEAKKIMDADFKDKELSEAMEKYRWDSIGLYSSWTHVKARDVHAKKVQGIPFEHRLYINTDMIDVHNMAKIFLDKCISNKLPYYFKISEFDRRDDNIVIYTDTKHLPEYLRILKEIEKEYPELVSRCKTPPILSGKVRNWIGYGSEPLALSGESSFNSIRAKSIKKAIEKELISWYKDNIKSTLTINGKKISLTDYFSQNVAKKEIESMHRVLKMNPNSKYIKYTNNDITNPQFTSRLERTIKANAPSIINSFLTEKSSTLKMEVPVNDRCSQTIYSSSLIQELKKFIKVIQANDPNFTHRVKERIFNDAKNYGIDPYKYCFDKKNVELLVNAELESKGQKTPLGHKKDNQNKQPQQPTKPKTSEYNANYHRPTGTPTSYTPMTDEEILASQRKLAEVPFVKVKK